MPKPHALLRLTAEAVLNELDALVAGNAVVLVLPEVAQRIWDRWSRECDAEERLVELEDIAQAKPDESREQAAAVVAAVAADRPIQVREALDAYLSCLPDTIRQSLGARPQAGTLSEVVVLEGPDDLLRLLPNRLPRFKLGDCPLPGVDLKLVQLLGVGGFGEVWKACNPHFDGVPPVALKFCLERKSKDRLLRHEAAVLNQVMRQGKHPGIVPLLRSYLTADPPCLEYEYVPGGDLAALIRERRGREGGVKHDVAARVVLNLAETMAFAHQLHPPIVHRDLKPSNILVQKGAGGKILFRIADFGIGGLAASYAIEETTRLGFNPSQFILDTLRGAFTPLYASPQQMRGELPDPRDDVYSLGVIWYQLLTGDLTAGRPGGKHWSNRLVEGGMPAGWIELLSACFEDNPDDRPADAGAFAADLTVLLKSSAADDHAETPTPSRDLAHQVQRSLQQVTRVHQRARYLAEREHDYEAAVRLLETVPAHLRDASMYEGMCRLRERVAGLDAEIRQAVQASQLIGLRPRVEALLELQPERTDLRRLNKVLMQAGGLPQVVVNSMGIMLVLIAPGSFLMGAPPPEPECSEREQPQHRVTITRPFYMGVYPVTQKEYEVLCRKPAATINPT
jgi:serine/threonine protein kinase